MRQLQDRQLTIAADKRLPPKVYANVITRNPRSRSSWQPEGHPTSRPPFKLYKVKVMLRTELLQSNLRYCDGFPVLGTVGIEEDCKAIDAAW
jgi:hypothetical protein